MKLCVAIFLLAGLLPLFSRAQLTNGGLYAGFGVDADTKTNFMQFGILTGNIASDDWFAPSGSGNNVIDTTNWASNLWWLKNNANISFTHRMSQPLYAKVGGHLWLDAVYARDFCAAASLKDSTVFQLSNKNGDNPTSWHGGVASVPAKNDLVDCYAHMRRDGLTVHDSLWFFGGVAAYGNAANSYYDIELYKNNISYDGTTKSFTTAGTAGGHSEWLFDASGNVIQTGDMILAVSFTPGATPVIDVRLWVSQTTFTNYTTGGMLPTYFKFNSFSTTTGTYGYGSIISNAGTTAFGAGLANYTGVPGYDSTYDTPWGSNNSNNGWSPSYVGSQFIEVGLNLTRIGVDPALYSALNPCQPMFADIFFKSRSSSSFISSLQDFVGPLSFQTPANPAFTAQGDTIRCNHQPATIQLQNITQATTFSWQVLGGGAVSGSSSDSSKLNISKPGTYIVSAIPVTGCPANVVDTIVVPGDTFPPVPSASAGMFNHQIYLYGGDAIASNYSTPFGGSKGLTYNWTGPNLFSSSVQNPVNDTVWGTYHLTVTEKRNGCTDTVSTTVLSSMFTILLADSLQLQGTAHGTAIDLRWKDANQSFVRSFVVERSNGVNNFQSIGTVDNPDAANNDGSTWFTFEDAHPQPVNNLYRIRAIALDGRTYYSQILSFDGSGSPLLAVSLVAIQPSGAVLSVRTEVPHEAMIAEYTTSGQLLSKKNVSLSQGETTVEVPAGVRHSVNVIALFIDGRLTWCQKILVP
jgi:hypothetical protein